MHGVIFDELRKFVVADLGYDAWEKIVKRAGVQRTTYLATQAYGDEELDALVKAGSLVSGIPVRELLEKFGEFIVPDLVRLYGPFIKPEWSALDLLANTEATMHRAVRVRDPQAEPPQLAVTREGDRVVISYSSPRKLCSVGKGIMRGISAHYQQPLKVVETTCMHLGAASCTLIASPA